MNKPIAKPCTAVNNLPPKAHLCNSSGKLALASAKSLTLPLDRPAQMLVNSPGEKCFVFSDPSDCRRTQRIRKALLRSAKRIPVRSESAVCSFAYFCCCNGKCVARCCSCRHSCAGACKRSSVVCVRSMRGVAAFPVLAFRDCGQLRASGELPCV